jgi:hypothetical protein
MVDVPGAKQPPIEPTVKTASFIVRVTCEGDVVTGIVERVATGQKERFEGCAAVGALIARMLEITDRSAGA